MSRGTSVGQVHEILTKRIADLKTQSLGMHQAAVSGARRPWMMPTGWTGGLFDIAGMTAPYNRDAINQNYEKALSNSEDPGTVADCIALKLQSDWLAVRERAFRLRHASSIRCNAHAAARRLGHGTNGGVYDTTVVKYIQDIIRQGISTPKDKTRNLNLVASIKDVRKLIDEGRLQLPGDNLPSEPPGNLRLDNLDRDQPIFVVPLPQ